MVEVRRSPYILENLEGDTQYEILIEAGNDYGLSEPSTRVVFKTKSEVSWVAVISAKKHKRQRHKRQSVTAKREKSQTPKFLTAILTLPNLT